MTVRRARGDRKPESVLLLVLTAPKEAIKWVWRHSGIWGLAALAIVLLAYFCWWNWEKVQHLPGVEALVAYLSEGSLPSAGPDQFSIAVAELEHDDPKHPYRTLIVQRLQEQFPHVQVLIVDRTIAQDDSPVPDAAERAGEAQAHKYLEKMGADVIIWGKVTQPSDQPKARPVAVGTALRHRGSDRPPHRSQRAELPHWAPTSGLGVESLIGPRMLDPRCR